MQGKPPTEGAAGREVEFVWEERPSAPAAPPAPATRWRAALAVGGAAMLLCGATVLGVSLLGSGSPAVRTLVAAGGVSTTGERPTSPPPVTTTSPVGDTPGTTAPASAPAPPSAAPDEPSAEAAVPAAHTAPAESAAVAKASPAPPARTAPTEPAAPAHTASPPAPVQSSCTTVATSNISANCYSATQGSFSVTGASGDGDPSGVDGDQAAQLTNGSWLEYQNIDFGSGSNQIDARVASGAPAGVSGLVKVMLDNPGNSPIATFEVGNTGGWSSWQTIAMNLDETTGTHDVYLVFYSGAYGNPPFVSLHYFDFPLN